MQRSCDQKITYFWPTKIEDMRPPGTMFAFARVFVFKTSTAIKASEREIVFREMSWDKIDDHADTGLMATIDENTKIIR